MDIPWVALGIAVSLFFASLLALDRLRAISTVLSSPERGFPKRVARRFNTVGWLVVVASGLVVLGIVVNSAWDMIIEHTRTMIAAGAWCGLGWFSVYAIMVVVLNGFGVSVYKNPPDISDKDGMNGAVDSDTTTDHSGN